MAYACAGGREGELESVLARTQGGGGQKSGECGRTYFLDGPFK